MKKLIFLTFLTLSLSTFSQSTPQAEMGVSKEDTTAIVSRIKDVEIQQLLETTSEFRECRDLYPFDAKDDEPKRTQKIEAAQNCFRQKLSRETNTDKLKKMADALGLQQYGLVKGNTAKDIQEYLNKKMYQSMTGVNPDEKDKQALQESLKFKNKKHIDQRVFITLYKNQVTKNSLYEVSRYCFEKFRVKSTDPGQEPRNFGDYWKKHFNPDAAVSTYTDSGEPSFGTISSISDKNQIYQDIIKNVGPNNFTEWNAFFQHCGQMIKKLCDAYKGVPIGNQNGQPTQSQPSSGLDLENTKSVVKEANSTTTTIGGPSCLALSRLQEYRQALTNAEKIDEQFAEMAATQDEERFMAAIMEGDPKIFGKDSRDESLDSLTNYTTKDVLEGNLQSQTNSKFERCNNEPELPECEGFVGKEEDYLKVQHKVELEMTLKREVEMARVRELKRKNDASLEEYLKENGFFDLLAEYKNMNENDLVDRIGKEFEARKVATLQEIQSRLGSRQIKDTATPDEKKTAIQRTAEEAAGERARLAQVVLFNNIITSHLELTRRDTSGNESGAGRNVGAWKKEQKALEDSSVDPTLFSNLQNLAEENSENGIGQNDQFGGLGFIETILGKKDGQ